MSLAPGALVSKIIVLKNIGTKKHWYKKTLVQKNIGTKNYWYQKKIATKKH